MHTSLQFDDVVNSCRETFLKKTKDYGTSWRVYRSISIADQIYIKARRIRTIQEKKTQKIKFCPTSNPSKVQRKNEKHADYKKRTEVLTFFASTRASDFDKWGYRCLSNLAI